MANIKMMFCTNKRAANQEEKMVCGRIMHSVLTAKICLHP